MFWYNSPAHGLVVDNLVRMTITTADGSTCTASSIENPDLFWAIRGGGCNFGIVTEFVYKLHPQRRTVYTGPMIFAPPVLEKLVSVTEKW
jgi:FAD/FMN-containing dehydrogenase